MNDNPKFDNLTEDEYVPEEEYANERYAILKDFLSVLDRKSKSSFTASYVQQEGLEKLRPEALGLLVADTSGWYGEKVAITLLTALASGLEDANWHTECAIVVGMIERMDAGETIAQVLKPLAGDT